jgi:YidC/Oxa1 family membrane protein insertase
MQQKRLIIALLISTAILFLWSYFAPVPQQKPGPTTQSPSPQASASQQNPTQPNAPVTVPSPAPAGSPVVAANTAPHRTLVIKTPLYDAKIDSRGAEAVSWIIKKNKDSGKEIFSVAGPKHARVPLELVSPVGL